MRSLGQVGMAQETNSLPSNRDALIEKAARYYYPLIVGFLTDADSDDHERIGKVFSYVRVFSGVADPGAPPARVHAAMTSIALGNFVRNGWLEHIDDPFATPYIGANEKTLHI